MRALSDLTAATVRPSGELTIAYAAERRSELLAALEDAAADGLVLDLRDVEELDTAGLQLLLAFRHEAAARAVPFAVAGVSDRVAAVLRIVGLDDDLLPAAAVPAVGGEG